MADIEQLASELSLDEKAALTAGKDVWTTVAVERLGIPEVRMSDGPNGVRGFSAGPGGPRSTCVPCGSALGATWNADLIEQIGGLLGREARSRGARVLLAPTVNIPRSPLAGRNFECYSEDPLLSGRMAAAFVRGVQAEGVATTVKHLVGNDAELERYTISSVIDERALREIYLLPFELAVREGGSLGVMTSYNRLNGRWCTERRDLLEGIVRREWGFDGIVVSDWFGVMGTVTSAEAGVDIEMPGPGRAFGPALAEAVRAGEIDATYVDAQVKRILAVLNRLGVLDHDAHPEPSDGEAAEPTWAGEATSSPDAAAVSATADPVSSELARRAATESMVLLANDGLLPLDRAAVRTLAVIGPNAGRAQIMGGGSARLRAHHMTTPVDALRVALSDTTTILHEPGCTNRRYVPVVGGEMWTPALSTDGAASAGESPAPRRSGEEDRGFTVEFFAGRELTGQVVHRTVAPSAEWIYMAPPHGLPPGGWSFRATARFTPSDRGAHTFTLVQGGYARLIVGGETVLDGFTNPPPRGEAFYGMGSEEMAAAVELVAAEPVDVIIEFATREASTPGAGAVRIGCVPPEPPDLMERAVAAAEEADVAVLVVGTTGEWESEGSDRTTMDLPGRQDELVRRVLDVNPDTVVVVNAASPVTMDWAASARALLQIWFGGEEMATALAQVLCGDAEPAGRLPVTLPERVEHTPAFGNFPGEAGEVRYGEGVLVGYRWYDARLLPVRFPFGHGGSYTTFSWGEATAASTYTAGNGRTLTVEVPVTNTGRRRGAEVVQCYVAPVEPGHLIRPPKELKAFAKLWLDPGETATARLVLDDRAFACWHPSERDYDEIRERAALVPMARRAGGDATGWQIDPGRYELRIGRSCAAIDQVLPMEVATPP